MGFVKENSLAADVRDTYRYYSSCWKGFITPLACGIVISSQCLICITNIKANLIQAKGLESRKTDLYAEGLTRVCH